MPSCNYSVTYFMPPAAAREKRILWGHPRPRQRTPSSALLFVSLPTATKAVKGIFRDALIHPPDARPRTPAKDFVLCTPVFHNHYAVSFSLCFFKGAGYCAEGELISIVDWSCFVWFQALAIDACGICAVEVGDGKGAPNMLDGGVYARRGIRALYVAQIDFWIDAADIMVAASHQRSLAS